MSTTIDVEGAITAFKNNTPKPVPELPFTIQSIEDGWDALTARLEQTGRCAIDTETTGDMTEDRYDTAALKKCTMWALGDHPFMMTASPDGDTAYYTYDQATAVRLLQHVEDAGYMMVFHNADFDLNMLRNWGWRPKDGYSSLNVYCTMLAHRIKFPGRPAALKQAAARYVDWDAAEYETAKNKWLKEHIEKIVLYGHKINKIITWDQVPPEIMIPYACADTVLTYQMATGLQRDIAAAVHYNPKEWQDVLPSMAQVVQDEIATMLVVVEMEAYGLPVDLKTIEDQLEIANTQLAQYIQEWNDTVGAEVNYNSHPQIRDLIYETEEPRYFTKGGAPATDRTALLGLQSDQSRATGDLILNIRNWERSIATLESMKLYARDGRIHTSFGTDTRTGRFSSKAPALQNQARFDEEKPWTAARDCVRAPLGRELITCDLSQIEPRLMAELSGDTAKIQAFRDGADYHSMTARGVFGLDTDEPVSKTQRNLGKIVNMATSYGMGAETLAERLRVAVPQEGALQAIQHITGRTSAHLYEALAHALLDSFWAANGPLRALTRYDEWHASTYGGIYTLMGQWRLVEPHKSTAYRVQASASDVMKTVIRKAEAACWEWCRDYILRMWEDLAIVLTLHDELMFELPSGLGLELAQYLDPILCDWPDLQVPIRFDWSIIKSGQSWAHKTVLQLPTQ